MSSQSSEISSPFTVPVSMRILGRHVKNGTDWGKMLAMRYATLKANAMQQVLRSLHQWVKGNFFQSFVLFEEGCRLIDNHPAVYELPFDDNFRAFCHGIETAMVTDDYSSVPWKFWKTSDEFVVATYMACRYGYLNYNQIATILSLHYGMQAVASGARPQEADTTFKYFKLNNPHSDYKIRQTELFAFDVIDAGQHGYFTLNLPHRQVIMLFFNALHEYFTDPSMLMPAVIRKWLGTYFTIAYRNDPVRYSRCMENISYLESNDTRHATQACVYLLAQLRRCIEGGHDPRVAHTDIPSYLYIENQIHSLTTSGHIIDSEPDFGMDPDNYRHDFFSMRFLYHIIGLNNTGATIMSLAPDFDINRPETPLLCFNVYSPDIFNFLMKELHGEKAVLAMPGAGLLKPWMMLGMFAPGSSVWAAMVREFSMRYIEPPTDGQHAILRYIEYPYPGIPWQKRPHYYDCYPFFLPLHDYFHTSLASTMVKHTYVMNKRLLSMHRLKDGLRYSAHFALGEYNLVDQDAQYGVDLYRYEPRLQGVKGTELSLYETDTYYVGECRRRAGILACWEKFGFGFGKLADDNYMLLHDLIIDAPFWDDFLFKGIHPEEFFPDYKEIQNVIDSFKLQYHACAAVLATWPHLSPTELVLYELLGGQFTDEFLNFLFAGYDFSRVFIWQPNGGLYFRREVRTGLRDKFDLQPDEYCLRQLTDNRPSFAYLIILQAMFDVYELVCKIYPEVSQELIDKIGQLELDTAKCLPLLMNTGTLEDFADAIDCKYAASARSNFTI